MVRVHVACSLITPEEVTGYKPDELGGDIEVTALKGTRFKRLPKILSLNVRPRIGGGGGVESIVLTHPHIGVNSCNAMTLTTPLYNVRSFVTR